jgi:hypothetical protein
LNSSFATREDGMGRFLIVLGAQFVLATVLLGALKVSVVAQLAPSSAPSDSSELVTVEAASGSPSRCNSEDIVVYQTSPTPLVENPCTVQAQWRWCAKRPNQQHGFCAPFAAEAALLLPH